MEFSLKKSFKLSKKNLTQSQEELPILTDHNEDGAKERNHHHNHIHRRETRRRGMGRDGDEVVVVDIADPKTKQTDGIWRENSGAESFHFNFAGKPELPENNNNPDPPTKLIGQFLHKQKASGDFALDMDLEMEELQLRRAGAGDLAPESEISGSESVRRRFGRDESDSERRDIDDQSRSSSSEVLRCTSSFRRDVSFPKRSSLLRLKTKSRLLDPPEVLERRSGRVQKSGPIQKSGLVPRSGPMKRGDEEEDDPFMDEDLPDEFKTSNLSALTLLQWLSLVLIIGALSCTLAFEFLRKKELLKLKLWKWEVLILVLICGRLVSGWGIRIVVFFIESNFLLRKRVLYFVYGVRKAVQNCLWLGLVLIAWHFLFDKRVGKETGTEGLRYVTKVLVCFLVGTLLWLVKTLIVKVLASSYHVSTYFDRIQESLFNQFVIETLSGPPLVESLKSSEDQESLAAEIENIEKSGVKLPPELEKAAKAGTGSERRKLKSGKMMSRLLSKKSAPGEDGITIDHLHKLNPKNVSAWNMKRLMRMVRQGALTTLDEQIIDSTVDDESAGQIRSEVEAKAAAKKIFQNVAFPGSKFIYMEDLMRFMREDEAYKTMSLFEGASESSKISKSSLKNWVVNAFRERRALALTLNDTKTAVNKLHHMVNIIVGILIGVIWLIILGIATGKFLLFVSSQLVLVAFIFGNTCKTVFEAIVFLFVMHPFDVGDRCEIDGVQMIVEEMNILTTVFLRFDNTKIIIPNSVLSTKAINNFYRSPDMGDGIEFSIHVATPADKIATLRQRLICYVENKKEHWYPAPMIIMKELEDLTRVRMAIWLCHRINYQDMGERYMRRSLLIEEMVRIFKELDIQYRLLPLEINVRAMPTVTSTRLN